MATAAAAAAAAYYYAFCLGPSCIIDVFFFGVSLVLQCKSVYTNARRAKLCVCVCVCDRAAVQFSSSLAALSLAAARRRCSLILLLPFLLLLVCVVLARSLALFLRSSSIGRHRRRWPVLRAVVFLPTRVEILG